MTGHRATRKAATARRTDDCRLALGRFAAVLTLVLGLLAQRAAAHDRSNSYSAWTLSGRTAQVVVRMWDIDVTHYEWGVPGNPQRDQMLAEYLTRHLQLLADGAVCPVTGAPRPLHADSGRLALGWTIECPASGALSIRNSILLDVAPSHLHFARLERDHQMAAEQVLSERQPLWQLDSPASGSAAATSGSSLIDYIQLGIEHILTGYDHLAFVLALLLLGSSLADVARVITGFTVAHSLTLSLAVLGYVRPERAPIEALIGLSIALVAIENAWLLSSRSNVVPLLVGVTLTGLAAMAMTGHGAVPALTLLGLAFFTTGYFGLLQRSRNRQRLRWAIAFLFGLLHGFGFASVLADAGLDPTRLGFALFGFNAGVEIGQLAVISLVWPLLRLLQRRNPTAGRLLVELGSALTAGLGTFWFVSRAFF